MKISYNWLSEYLSKKIPPREVASALTMSIAEVEGIEEQAAFLEKCVVGVVKAIEPHPNADRLKLVTVDVGRESLKVVCGGANLYEGMNVAFAHVGARVKWRGEILTTLEPAVIRGEQSHGMICASVELGLADRFPASREREVVDLKGFSAKAGTPLAKALGRDDVIFTIDNKSLTHRADLFSHVGIAREVAVAAGIGFREPKMVRRQAQKGTRLESLALRMEEKQLCRRNMNVMMSVQIGPSPDWLKHRLEAIGQRSINNVVDVTNYVMHEYGQPLHAFDASKVADHTIVVRRARDAEEVTTLDGVRRTLTRDMLVIADSEKALDIAGVMGGENSEVRNDTTHIILEASNLDPLAIRKTSQTVGLRTEGVVRWEKGLTTPLVEQGFWRAVDLFHEVADAAIVSRALDAYPVKEKTITIMLRYDYLMRLIGKTIPAKTVAQMLKTLGCTVRKSKGGWKVTPPIPRHDLTLEEDLIEEVARVYGYNNIPLTPLVGTLELPEVDREKECERDVVRACVDLGFTEVYTHSFYGDAEIQKNALTMKHAELANSQSEELKYARASLLPGLLAAVQKNVKQRNTLRFVEGGHIFPNATDEHSVVTGVLTGERSQAFLAAKGAVERILSALSITPNFTVSGDGCAVMIRGQREGSIGHISDSIRQAHHIPADVAFFTLNIPALANACGGVRRFVPLPNFPSVYLDLAFEVQDTVAYEEIEHTIRKAGEPLLASVELFDVYEGNQITKNHRSLAFHLVYQAPDRTLTLEEATKVHQTIIQSLKKQFTIIVRGEAHE